jgi:hypothetical protein
MIVSYQLTPTQALLLFGLLARHGACAQAALIPQVKAADRLVLVKANLISSLKVGRGLKLKLEDRGWAWVAANLSAELPKAQRTLSDVLARLSEHLAKSGETLADFIGSSPEQVPPQRPPVRKRNELGNKSAQSKSPSSALVRKRIESAYLAVTHGRKNEPVRLSRLRAELSDLDRATVDAAFGRILKGDKKASLMRHDDPRQIDQADRDAAFSPAGEPFHVIWIAS